MDKTASFNRDVKSSETPSSVASTSAPVKDAARSSLGLDTFYKKLLHLSSGHNSGYSPSSSPLISSHTSSPSIAVNHSDYPEPFSSNQPKGIDNSDQIIAKVDPFDQKRSSCSKIFPYYELTGGQMHELHNRDSSSLESRIRVIDELSITAKSQQFSETTYNFIFHKTSDLLDKSQTNNVRHKVWRLYTQLVNGQAEKLGQLRCYLFNLVRKYDARDEDIPFLIDFLIALTDSGKTLAYYEANMADFMTDFYANLIERNSNIKFKVKKLDSIVHQNFLKFMINLIKYNAACIASDNHQAIILMIQYACELAYVSDSFSELELIYQFLNVVLSYSHLPSEVLSQFVVVLCIGVNNNELYQICTKIMRNLIGTYLGFACLDTLHHIIEDETNFVDIVLIRGAVYFLVQSLWGELAHEKVALRPNTILPAFKNLIVNESITSPCIALEISNGIHIFISMVTKLDNSAHLNRFQTDFKLKNGLFDEKTSEIVFEYTWELVLDICYALAYKHLFQPKENEWKELKSMIIEIVEKLKEFLDKELSKNLYQVAMPADPLAYDIKTCSYLLNDTFIKKIFSILELSLNNISESSIVNLISHQLNHTGQNRTNWVEQLKHVMEVFFVSNTDHVIRAHCLNEIQKFLQTYQYFVDVDSFWEKVASQYFLQQSDIDCPELVANFLIFIAKNTDSLNNLSEIIEIFEKIANHRLKMFQRQHSVEILNSNRFYHIQISHQNSAPISQDISQFNDIIQAINGLIIAFREKIHHPTCHYAATQAFGILIKISSFFYKPHSNDDFNPNSCWPRTVTTIKQMIFKLILSLRTNTLGQLGVVLDSEELVQFTPYILVREIIQLSSQLSPPTSPEQNTTKNTSHTPLNRQQSNQTHSEPPMNTSCIFHLSLLEALKLVCNCIDIEIEWSVLDIIFKELPKFLKHKGLLIQSNCYSSANSPASSNTHLNELEYSIPDSLVVILYKFIDNMQSRYSEIYFSDIKLSKTDILSLVYNSISAMVGYKLCLQNQSAIIKCLQNGLVHFSSKISSIRQCIVSLTLCSIEMQTIMNKYLHDIIISLSKISTNKALAVPKLEFLSNIILFPDLYYTFTIKQYLSIFMIAQSYINPYKYGEYKVALALRVISMWFLKCPTSNRHTLVKFFTKGLQTNILKEVEPNTPQLSQRLSSISLNSEHRPRLENRLSLISSPSPPPTTPVNVSLTHFSFSSIPQSSSLNSPLDHHPIASSSSAFNVCATSANTSTPSSLNTEGLILDPNDKENSKIELVEVCMDMLASNAFTTSSPLPLKPSMIDKLLNKEKSQIWIIGHKLIQVTTTGCTSRAIRNGLCSKCFNICHMNNSTAGQKESSSLTSLAGQIPMLSDHRYSSQFSEDNSNTQAASMSSRRRHRSEINSNSARKSTIFTNDDSFINRTSAQMSSSDSDLNGANGDGKFCRCWCQSWAEILIRRATGNTRLIMRVENNLGDFPHWNFTKDDDSLAQIFKHSDPEINLALKLQKASELDTDLSTEDLISKNTSYSVDSRMDNEKSSTINAYNSVHTKNKAGMPVTRAASFGSRRPAFIDTHISLDSNQSTMQARAQVLRRLEKNHSFEESGEHSRTNLTSPVTSNSSSETISNIASNSSSGNNGGNGYRDRGYTISVMSPVQKSASSSIVGGSGQHSSHDSSMSSSNLSLTSRQPVSPGGLSPEFVFLQLYYNSAFKDESEQSSFDKPILLDKKSHILRSIKCLDCTTPYETHKIGVLYIGPGQATSRSDILANQIGSYRYTRFLMGLGQLISLEDVDPKVCYVGGLDATRDGPFAISWGDHLVQVIFHVATFMPTLPNDPNGNNKLAHIGNDFVCIVYNNSGQVIDLSSIKGGLGQVHQAMVVITPLEHESNIVEIRAKRDFAEFIGHQDSQMLSDQALPIYARQLALHANLGAMVSNSNKNLKSYHISNWISRLQNIKRIRVRSTEQSGAPDSSANRVSPSVQSQPSAGVHGRVRIGSGPSQSSKEESDSVISSCTTSPSLQSAGYNVNSGNSATFDYECGKHRLAFPDFTEFTK